MSDAPVSFKNAAAFRAWLTRHHSSSDALVVSLSKVRTGRGLTYAQALDEALCFGWIRRRPALAGRGQLFRAVHAAPAAQHLEPGQYRARGTADRAKVA